MGDEMGGKIGQCAIAPKIGPKRSDYCYRYSKFKARLRITRKSLVPTSTGPEGRSVYITTKPKARGKRATRVHAALASRAFPTQSRIISISGGAPALRQAMPSGVVANARRSAQSCSGTASAIASKSL
jgi:hypothetical protein